ncbi:DddA-like double-stranded DNA deaminase toxin [Actinokineospora sp. 24-640]
MSISEVAAQLDRVTGLLSAELVMAARACLAEARELLADASQGTSRPEADHASALLDQAHAQLQRVAAISAGAKDTVAAYRTHIAGAVRAIGNESIGPPKAPATAPAPPRPIPAATEDHGTRAAELLNQLPVRGPEEPKTSGYWIDDDGQEHGPLTSGRKDGYAEACGDLRALGLAPARGDLWAATHVEVKLAVRMRRANARRVTLVINNKPCDSGPWSCDRLLSQILKPGQSVIVYYPGGMVTYTGKRA